MSHFQGNFTGLIFVVAILSYTEKGMPLLTDLSLEPLPGHLSFVTGILGLSSTLLVRGVIRFECSKDSACLMGLTLSLKGVVSTSLSVSGSSYSSSETLISKETLILGDTIHPVKTPQGSHSLPFELVIKEPQRLLGSYQSPSILGKKHTVDGGCIDYKLSLEMETLGGLFGSKRNHTIIEEPVYIRSINLSRVSSALRRPLQSPFSGEISDLMVQVEMDRHVMFPGTRMDLCVAVSGGEVLDMTVELLQEETLHAKGQTRTVDYYLSKGSHYSLVKVQDGILRSTLILDDDSAKDKHGSVTRLFKKTKDNRDTVRSPFTSSLISVSHKVRLTFVFKNRNGVKETGTVETPFLVLDLDRETIAWVRNHCALLVPEGEQEEEEQRADGDQKETRGAFVESESEETDSDSGPSY